MVRRPPREFEQFLSRVRRRFIVLRVVERAGLGVLFACAAAIPLLLIALWLGRPTAPLAPMALLIGALGGLVWGVLARPTPLEAAMEADRQLGWADLLGSALSVMDRSDDPWARAVQLAADQRCRGALARSVILNRLGARAWGGIGLAGALVSVLALAPTYSTPSQAEENPHYSAGAVSLRPQEQASVPSARQGRRAFAQPDPEDADAARSGQEPDATGESQANRQQDSKAPPPHAKGTGDSQGTGGGESHTNVKDPGALREAQHASRATAADPTGAPKSGSGHASNASRGAVGSQAGNSSAGTAGASAPPWQSADWPSEVKQAHEAVESGQVPDAYRDVIRGYFDRQ